MAWYDDAQERWSERHVSMTITGGPQFARNAEDDDPPAPPRRPVGFVIPLDAGEQSADDTGPEECR